MSKKQSKILSFSPSRLSKEKRDKLIVDFLPTVKIIAKKVYQRLPANYELDDLISCGVIGLMDAIEKYDPAQEVKFQTYAEYRVKGRILDELRASDWASRATREKIKSFEKAEGKLNFKLGRQATDGEVCKAFKINYDEYYKLLERVRPVQLLSLNPETAKNSLIQNALIDKRENTNPGEIISLKNLKIKLKERVDLLPDKEGKVIHLYYYEDKTMKEISQILEVTESRISQLHQSSVGRLRKRAIDLDWKAA
jgi:RNA polymerase sigma factor FliA